jgi:hypothetical protein
MSRYTQGRRWSVSERRRGAGPMTEHGVTPDEARSAMAAIVLQTGHQLERVEGYEPRSDRFTVAARSADGRLVELTVYGETVAKTVHVSRVLRGANTPLRRPSEMRAASRRA